MHPGRKSGGWLLKKDREEKHANNGSLWLLRLAVGQRYLCRSAGLCREKLERRKIWETSAHCWVNLHDEMGAQEWTPVQFATSLFSFGMYLRIWGIWACATISPAASSPVCLCWSPVARCCEPSQSEPQRTLCSSPAFPSDSSATKSKSNLC